MYYNEYQTVDGFGIKSIGKAIKKVVKKVVLPVAAVVAAPATGGGSLAAYGAVKAAGTAKANRKAGIKQTNALMSGNALLTKKQEKIAVSGKVAGSVPYSAMNPAQLNEERARLNALVASGKDVKDAKAKLDVLTVVQNAPAKAESLNVGSSGTAVEIAVAQSSPKTSPAELSQSAPVAFAPASDPLAVLSSDAPATVAKKKKSQAKRAKKAASHLKALQQGTSGAKAEAAALAAQTGTTTAEALQTLIAQAQASVAAGGAPMAPSSGGGGFFPTQDSTANMLEQAGDNAAAPASPTLKYGLIAGGVAAAIYLATRRK